MDTYLHSRNVLIISVQITVVNFITLVKINLKESLQYSHCIAGHYVSGVGTNEPKIERRKITRLFEFGIGPCPKEKAVQFNTVQVQ